MGFREGIERKVMGLLPSLGKLMPENDFSHWLINSDASRRVLEQIISRYVRKLENPTNENILDVVRTLKTVAGSLMPDGSDRVYESKILGAIERNFEKTAESGEDSNLTRKVKRTLGLMSRKNIMTLMLSFGAVGVGLGAINDRYLSKKGEPYTHYLTLQVNSECNVKKRCPGCFAAADKGELSYETLDGVVTQSIELGSRYTVIIGGEPLLRKDDLLKLLRKHKKRPFLVATNGMLLDDAYAEEVADLGNTITFINTPGLEALTTELRRDANTWTEIRAAAETLKKHGAASGFASTVYSANFRELSSPEFIQQAIDWEMVAGLYFNYTAPMGHSPVQGLSLSTEMGDEFSERVREVSSTHPIVLVNTYKGEEKIGGCPAARRGMIYVQSDGRVGTCPMFMPPSNMLNVKTNPLKDILSQPYFSWLERDRPMCAGAPEALAMLNATIRNQRSTPITLKVKS